MTNSKRVVQMWFTVAELKHIGWALWVLEQDGHYYGSRGQFESRADRIGGKIGSALAEVEAK